MDAEQFSRTLLVPARATQRIDERLLLHILQGLRRSARNGLGGRKVRYLDLRRHVAGFEHGAFAEHERVPASPPPPARGDLDRQARPLLSLEFSSRLRASRKKKPAHAFHLPPHETRPIAELVQPPLQPSDQVPDPGGGRRCLQRVDGESDGEPCPCRDEQGTRRIFPRVGIDLGMILGERNRGSFHVIRYSASFRNGWISDNRIARSLFRGRIAAEPGGRIQTPTTNGR